MRKHNTSHRHRRRHTRHSNKGGNALAQAVVPFGLLGLSNYLSGRKHRRGTRKGMRRKTARRAYMTKRGRKLF